MIAAEMNSKFRRCSLDELVPEMKVGQAVFNDLGQCVLEAGIVLTAAMIERLAVRGLDSVIVEQQAEKAAGMLSVERQRFSEGHAAIVEAVQSSFDNIRKFKEVPIDGLTALANQCVDSLVYAPGVVQHLQNVRRKDEYTYRHSVNVAVMTGVIGKWLDWKPRSIRECVLAGLLHDVGKVHIAEEILNKPESLTPGEMKMMKGHARLGAKMLEGCGVSERVRLGVLQHHERVDGSGYHGLQGEDISSYARIIAIADVFDAMTSERVYKAAKSPFAALAELSKQMFDKFSPEVCVPFVDNLTQSLVGAEVALSDGSTGSVLHIERHAIHRPVIKTECGRFINLLECAEVEVVGVL